MRIERAIDAFLDWRRLERDATPRSTYSYRRILEKLAEDYPELELSRFTKPRALDQWRGAAGLFRLNYRWPTVTQFASDLQHGLAGDGHA